MGKSAKKILCVVMVLVFMFTLTGCGGGNSALHGSWVLDGGANNTDWDWVELEFNSNGTGRSVEAVLGSEIGFAITWEVNDGRLSMTGSVLGMVITEVYDFEIASGQLRLTQGSDVWHFIRP
jgi:hypothetical protein